jgi:tRNA pseudouridine-54 N-methylase
MIEQFTNTRRDALARNLVLYLEDLGQGIANGHAWIESVVRILEDHRGLCADLRERLAYAVARDQSPRS